jgi:hypothetical protein
MVYVKVSGYHLQHQPLLKFGRGKHPPTSIHPLKPKTMGLNLSALQGVIKRYGAPLYASEPTNIAGALGPDEYELVNDGTVIKYFDNGLPVYFPIRKSAIDAGFGEDRVFNVAEFEATRDASGEDKDGKPWSVTKGALKAFAY